MISVVIITKNESAMIKTCLESVKWADEVIVADSGSTDDTIAIAKGYAKIIKVTGDSFSGWRNQALNQVKSDWILFVDADERVLKPLYDEIQEIINIENSQSAWAIPRRNVILGEEKSYAAFWPDYVIRLFKKDKLKGYKGEVHEQPEFTGDLGKLKNPFLHLTHRDIDSMVLKSLTWANIDAKLMLQVNHSKMTGTRFVKVFFSEFFSQLIIRGAIWGGTIGVIDGLLQVFSKYLSYVKLWQLQRKNKLAEAYQDIDQNLINNNFNFPK